MAQYKIRQATHDDAAELARLRWDFSPDEVAASGQTFAEFLEGFIAFVKDALDGGDWTIWVVEQDGRLTHNIWVEAIRKVPRPGQFEKRFAYITNVYADPDVRGQGVGTELLNHAIEWGRKRGFEFLLVWPSEESVRFYERAGFVHSPEAMELLYEE